MESDNLKIPLVATTAIARTHLLCESDDRGILMHCAILLLLLAVEPAAFGPGNHFRLEHHKDDFGMRSHGIVEYLRPQRTKLYPLPQSSFDTYRRLRKSDTRINSVARTGYQREEVIGPVQVEGNMLWFGNNYYDGEGTTGIGAFGYFDTSTHTYTIFSPPEVARYEISAILVQPEIVWVALDRFGEDISRSPGGLISWDRTTHKVRKYDLEFNVASILAQGDSLRLKTHDGYALFRYGELHRFLTNGKAIARFAPPPTKN